MYLSFHQGIAMSSLSFAAIAAATALALISLGGGLYGFLVVDPAWPRRPDIIQPARGGISQKRFWIPAHTVFELALIASLVLAWSHPSVQDWLWVGFASHLVMRLWSAFDFIPKALAFERAAPGTITAAEARRWTRRSWLRLPLDLITCFAMFDALVAAARLT
jgi:hypothetical protein